MRYVSPRWLQIFNYVMLSYEMLCIWYFGMRIQPGKLSDFAYIVLYLTLLVFWCLVIFRNLRAKRYNRELQAYVGAQLNE